MERANKGLLGGLIAPFLLGMTIQSREAHQTVLSHLKDNGPFNRTTFLSVQDMNFLETLTAFSFQDMFQYFDIGAAILQQPLIQKVLNNDAILGYHGVPQMPVFFYQAIGDVIPISQADALVGRYCGVGANIKYRKNSVGDHNSELTNGVPAAEEFLASVFAGTYNHTGCSVETVAVGSGS